MEDGASRRVQPLSCLSKDRIILGCRGGTLAVLDRALGKVIWSKKVPSRFDYEPLLLENKLLYFKGKSAVLADIADGKEKALTYGGTAAQPATAFAMPQDPVTSIAYYKGSLIIVDRAGETWHDRRQRQPSLASYWRRVLRAVAGGAATGRKP